MKYIYPAIFRKEGDSIIVDFPDLEGCVTYGRTEQDALQMANEALEGYLESLISRKIVPAPASSILDVEVSDHTFTSFVSVDIDLSKYSKSVRKTLTIPCWLNDRALDLGLNFSQVLQEALLKKIQSDN